MAIEVRIEYSQADDAWFAGLLRDGASWILGGALVGAGSLPADAVYALVDNATYLVEHGHNAMMDAPLGLADRVWLFKLLDAMHDDGNQDRYAAMRQACGGTDPYAWTAEQADA
jgi:hypothetical protein